MEAQEDDDRARVYGFSMRPSLRRELREVAAMRDEPDSRILREAIRHYIVTVIEGGQSLKK